MKSKRLTKEVKRVENCFALIATLFTLLFTSCIIDSIEPQYKSKKGPISSVKISFEVSIDQSSDADLKKEWKNGDKIGLFAVRHAPNEVGELAATDNYLHNLALRYDDKTDTWTSVTTMYFPAGGDQLDFYAYYPYNAKVTDPRNITFNVSTDQDVVLGGLMGNLMFSNSSMDVDLSTPLVSLDFSHAFAIAELKVKGVFADLGEVTATLQGCNTTGSGDLSSGTLEVSGTAQEVKMFRLEQPGDANYTSSYTYRAIVPAQRIASGSKLFNINTNYKKFDSPALSSASNITSGRAERYEMSLGFYAIGDYYPDPNVTFKSDGSVESGIAPIGIVYLLDEPIVGRKSEHGKIVSLNEPSANWSGQANQDGSLPWSTETVTTIANSDIDGVFNTNRVKANNPSLNLYPAFKWCYEKRDGDKKWYIPAQNEIFDINREVTMLNNKLLAAKKTQIRSGWYWSSTESGAPHSRAVIITGGDDARYDHIRKGDHMNVRAISTF